MVSRSQIGSILEDYGDITIATVCSHSSLQIFHGARQEGFRTLGIAVGKRPKFYDAFPLAKPDEFLVVDGYKDIPERADDLVEKNVKEFRASIKPGMRCAIQEYIIGTRYYMHYFYSPIVEKGYRLSKGSLEMLGIDRRDEANIDEMYKLGAQERLRELGLYPTFVVTGNMPVVLRESLIPAALEMAERVVERSLDLFGGMIGPFCLETIVQDNLKFKVFEISTRIVAGTNLFVGGSPYSELSEPGMSTGRRIARELKLARKAGRLMDVVS